MPINRVLEAIEEIKKGNMVVMVDDEDRENEGDLVYAGTFSTAEKVNFMATEAKGLICVSITKETADRLDLAPMVKDNNSQHETAFTVSIDAKDAKTGISAYERDLTIKLLSNIQSQKSDFVKPGHIFPLVAKDGGVLVRTGHTEGSVDICKLAGVTPSAVICEIMKDNGEMARRDDLDSFAKKHNLKIVYISDIVEYRLKYERLITIAHREHVEFFGIDTEKVTFIDHNENKHYAFIFGELKQSTNVRLHNITSDYELFSNNRKFLSLISSIEYLKNSGGVLIFLDSKSITSEYIKDVGIGSQILNLLGIKNIKLLSSEKRDYVGICGFGLNILEDIII